jgi:hypothetical protein
MGKLHTLRRAIKREPDKWRYAFGNLGAGRDWKTGQWYPSYFGYKRFVRKVLAEHTAG